MTALILNSGVGSRAGALTKDNPKCMIRLKNGETILERQLRILGAAGIKKAVITTGPFDAILIEHAKSVSCGMDICFIHNPEYTQTNYIYSIYLARCKLCDDTLLLHGDLVFSPQVLKGLLKSEPSACVVSESSPLPEKDFKAVVRDGYVSAVGVEFFNEAAAMQPMYKLNLQDWQVWLESICEYIKRGERQCYAENAFNRVSEKCRIRAHDIGAELCLEVDTVKDLETVNNLIVTI